MHPLGVRITGYKGKRAKAFLACVFWDLHNTKECRARKEFTKFNLFSEKEEFSCCPSASELNN